MLFSFEFVYTFLSAGEVMGSSVFLTGLVACPIVIGTQQGINYFLLSKLTCYDSDGGRFEGISSGACQAVACWCICWVRLAFIRLSMCCRSLLLIVTVYTSYIIGDSVICHIFRMTFILHACSNYVKGLV